MRILIVWIQCGAHGMVHEMPWEKAHQAGPQERTNTHMAAPLMKFEEVRAALKQRFPMIMVDSVTSLEPGKSIQTTKNVTGSEIQFLGHFPEHAVMPGTLIVEAIGQSASILFSKTTGTGTRPGEFLVLGSINNMRFLAPVVPGDRIDIELRILKLVEDLALVEAVATVDHTVVATGKLGFARRSFQPSSNKTSDSMENVTSNQEGTNSNYGAPGAT
jgi:3-hydroxyacyl-[acyl-carrier-protein] dehydratase